MRTYRFLARDLLEILENESFYYGSKFSFRKILFSHFTSLFQNLKSIKTDFLHYSVLISKEIFVPTLNRNCSLKTKTKRTELKNFDKIFDGKNPVVHKANFDRVLSGLTEHPYKFNDRLTNEWSRHRKRKQAHCKSYWYKKNSKW